MFSKFFIDRPIFATVTALLFVVAGLISLSILPIAQYPDITPPTVMVNATYPGANAQTVAQTVGIPIEQQVNGVDGMMYMSSTSSASGSYSLTVTFEVGTDIDMATVMVQNRVSVALNSLPEAVKQQGVTVQKQSSGIVLLLTLTGDSIYDGLYLSNYANLNLSNQLTRVKGVGSVSVMGVGNYSMRVWLNPETMRARGVSAQQVYSAIQSQNMEVSAGYVGQPIGVDPNNSFQYTLNVKGRLTTPEEFGDIIIATSGNNKILRLKDIAKIELGSVQYGEKSRLQGKPAAAIGIYQLPGSNSINVAEAVKARMAELEKSFPPGIKYQVTLDTTDVIHDSIADVMKTFVEALVLVVLVIFLFLQNWRATLIPCLSIPVSLIGTLAVMAMLGFSINTLTLFGLVLAIAIVVDDAIVVVEDVTRILDEGKLNAKEATTEAMEELMGAIVGIVLVLLAVFIPTTLISGISGQLYKQFALTIAASTVISGFNSLTLTPALCGLLLKPSVEVKAKVFIWFNKFYDWLQDVYDGSVRWLLANPIKAIGSYIIISILTIVWFIKWPTTFIPEEDQGYFMIAAQLPPASSLDRSTLVGNQINAILSTYPEVKSYMEIDGLNIMSMGQSTNAVTYFVTLKPWKDRPGKEHSASAVADRLNKEAYVKIQEAQVFSIIPPAIPGMGVTGGLQFQLEDRKGLGVDELQKALNALMISYNKYPAISSMSSSYQADVPQYTLDIDRDKVQLMGLQLNQVYSALSYYLGQAYVNDFVEFGRIFQVRLEASGKSQKYIDDVLKLGVPNSDGELVPFSSFTKITPILGMDQITRYNLYTAAAVTANVAQGSSSGQAIKEVGDMIDNELGGQFGYEWTGIAYQETTTGNTTVLVFAIAMLVAFLVLAAQYESWTSPVAAVMGVPMAILGAILGCWIMGLPISIYTQIGLVLLIGLSAKNGILIVEFARDYRKAGNSIQESAYEAGHVRLRPILMTSFTFVLGVMPLMFASGAGAGSRIALGTAVVFGMFVNTVFATSFIPNWFEVMQHIQEKWLTLSKHPKPATASTVSNDDSKGIASETVNKDAQTSATNAQNLANDASVNDNSDFSDNNNDKV